MKMIRYWFLTTVISFENISKFEYREFYTLIKQSDHHSAKRLFRNADLADTVNLYKTYNYYFNMI